MDMRILFNAVRELWPYYIDLTRSNANDDGMPFWELVEIYERIERGISSDDVWMDLSAWAFHQALVELAENAVAQNVSNLDVSEVSLEMFDHYIRENLADPSWEEERAAYTKHNGVDPINPMSF